MDGFPQSPSVLSLFSGAGGMDIGLEAAGFDSLGCVEWDESCRQSLRTNRPAWPLHEPYDVVEFVRSLEPSRLGVEVGELALLAGGPPCQPFSTAAQWSSRGRRGMEDSRFSTVPAMMEAIRRLLPHAVLIENVAGFFSGKQSAKEFIESQLEEINLSCGTGYVLDVRIVNASHFGVPQNRRRAIGVISRSGRRLEWPSPTHLGAPITAWDVLHDVPHSSRPERKGNWSDLLPSIPEGANYQYLTSEGAGQELFGYRTKFWSFLLKLAKDQPSWTLPASPGPSTGPFHWDNRPLSAAEMMRLQTFPDSWRIEGGFRSQVKQLGNATPPLLAEIFGRQIRRQFFGETGLSEVPSLAPSRAVIPPPSPAAPVPIPARFVELVGPKPRHPGSGEGPAPRAVEASSS